MRAQGGRRVEVAGTGSAEGSGVAKEGEPKEDPDLAAREKISENLTKGLPILAAVLSTVAAYKGGLARVVLNQGRMISGAVLLILFGLLAAVFSWWAVRRRPGAWTFGVFLAVSLTLAGSAVGIFAAGRAVGSYDRPTATAAWKDTSIEFTGEINLLKADEYMTVTLHGYPLGWERAQREPGQSGEARGSELYRSTTGPDSEGTARSTGAVLIDKGAFEIIELRVHRLGQDSECLNKVAPDKRPPSACIQIWTRPRPPLAPPPG